MQQVNLYQPILRKQEKVFSAKTLLQGNLLVLAGLVALYAYTVVQTHTMQSQLSQVSQQRDEQTRKLAELVTEYPPKSKNAGLKQHIEQAQASLQHKRRLLAAVDQLELDKQSGFSEHLTGLARQDLPQLWLQHIYLQQGQQVSLRGSAFEAEQVAIYLQRLGKETAFSGTAFQQVEISRNEEHAGRVDFTLDTQASEVQR